MEVNRCADPYRDKTRCKVEHLARDTPRHNPFTQGMKPKIDADSDNDGGHDAKEFRFLPAKHGVADDHDGGDDDFPTPHRQADIKASNGEVPRSDSIVSAMPNDSNSSPIT